MNRKSGKAGKETNYLLFPLFTTFLFLSETFRVSAKFV